MNQEQLNQFRNRVRSLITRLNIKRNVIYLNTHNSKQHEKIKFEICYELQKQKKHYITEAPLRTVGGRGTKGTGIADIVVLDDCQAIEIMFSETINDLKWKTKKFPRQFEIIAVRSFEEYLNNGEVIKIGTD